MNILYVNVPTCKIYSIFLIQSYISGIEDLEEIDTHASLEETIQKAEQDRVANEAERCKRQIREILFKLSEEYSKIVERFESRSVR